MPHRGAPLLVVVASAVVSVVALGRAAVPGADAEVRGAVITVSPATVSLGDQVRVDLTGWPEGVVTASVCGNAAKRGSTDCDQIGGGSTRVPANGTETLTVDVLAPPVACPCVVRATTTLGDVVRTAPITVLGVPTGVDIPAASGPPAGGALAVTTQLRNADVEWPQSWSAAFAGPAHKELVLTMRNTTDDALDGLRVAGRVGHAGSDEGEPVDAVVPMIRAHTMQRVVVPVLLSAPVYGDYVVRGAVYGLAVPVRFEETTSSEPWALELGLPLALLLVAQLLRARDRHRRAALDRAAAAEALPEPEPATLPVEFPQSSPVVGEGAVEGLESSSYALASMGTVHTATPELVDVPVEEALR